MFKTICLGDIHGRDIWKHIVSKENPDRIIFIGDYFDSFDYNTEKQMNNFLDICAYKRTGGKEVIMLIGNHDFHYFPEIGDTGTSGYQRGAAKSIEHIINENRDLLQIAYSFDNFLFTHAGVSNTFLFRATSLHPNYEGLTISEILNELFKYKSWAFEFNGKNPYGDDITQSCIWIRPKSLMKDAKNIKKEYIQIVGHTQQNQIDIKGKSTGGKYYFIDTLGTSKEYLIIEDGEISVGMVKLAEIV
jgi:predicted MPP superfamily phosphohydrolase